jgi:mRNA-degrading endonuclease toxin of MazEF toxin-antitoxin module
MGLDASERKIQCPDGTNRQAGWTNLPDQGGSRRGRGHLRPVVVVQGDAFNASKLRTVVCVVLTTGLAVGTWLA